jgi:hypothetical protein
MTVDEPPGGCTVMVFVKSSSAHEVRIEPPKIRTSITEVVIRKFFIYFASLPLNIVNIA